MQCPQCRHLNANEAAFCGRCGGALAPAPGSAWNAPPGGGAPAPAPSSSVLGPGQVVLGRYRVEAILGEGAMSIVYRVSPLQGGAPSALKVLSPSLVANWKARERMARESRALARVQHPNVIELRDVLELGDTLALELELLSGGTLASRIARGPLELYEAVRIASEILSGLEAIHEAGLIHRDLKPGNVLMTPGGVAKVADLGIALDPNAPLLTAPGTLLGTPAYMSPEQIRCVEVGPESDLYACGIILYEMLTTTIPFDSRLERDVLAAHLGQAPNLSRLPVALPEALREVIRVALEKQPERRWSRASAMRTALGHAAAEPMSRAVTSGWAPSQPLRIGEYTVRRLIGEGGMGRVYEAEERLSGRRVALKVLRSEIARAEPTRGLFLNEMAILAELDHPNIVRSLASLEVGGELVMVLEYLSGQTLRQRLVQAGRLGWHEAVWVATQVANALERAHSTNPPIVHRDLKPENVMLLEGGGVKVMDFGIAKVLGAVNRTATATIGTLAYMSPEQIDARPVDARSDLYGLGLVLYEMLAGKPPFVSDSQRDLLNQQCTEPPPGLPDEVRRGLPRGIERLTLELLAKAPAERPPSARAVREALEPFTEAAAGTAGSRGTTAGAAPVPTPPAAVPPFAPLAVGKTWAEVANGKAVFVILFLSTLAAVVTLLLRIALRMVL